MKTALIIDGNYLLHKDVFILHQMRSLHKDLQNLMRLDIDKLTKLYSWDDIYFVSDSKIGYWRKTEFNGYKEKRKPDEKIDWEWVYQEYETLRNFLKEETDIRQLQFDWAEGDDIIAYIVNRNNELGYSNVIIAADSDIHQLLRFDLSKEYINIVHNYKFSDERLYTPQSYNIFLSEMKRQASSSLFDMNNDDEFLMFLEDLIHRTKTIEVSNEEIIFTKLVSGDKKDSVPSVYLKKTTTDKLMGIGKDGAKTIYKLYKETYPDPINFDSNDFVDKATEMVSYVKKVTENSSLDDIKTNIRRNRKLLILTEKYLPKDLLNVFDDKINIGESVNSNPFELIEKSEEKEDTSNPTQNDIDDFFFN
jgi:hypothetical protein